MRRTAVVTGALCGVVAGAVVLGVATLVAALMDRSGRVGGTASPLVAVGSAFVDRTPRWLKEAAVSAFGTADKVALWVGMALVLTALAALVGIVAVRALRGGLLLLAALGAVACAAVLTRPGSQPTDALATLVGVVAGTAALAWLVRRARRAGAAGSAVSPRAWGPPLERRDLVLGYAGLTAMAVAAAAAGQALGGRARSVAASRAAVRLPAVARPVVVPAAASLDVPGLTPFLVPTADFYRIDIALAVPQVSTGDWRLRVHGLVEREVELRWEDLLAAPLREALVTLACVSNEVGGDLVGNARWTGWPVRELLARAGPLPGADMVLSSGADGFSAGTPLAALTDGRDALLAVGMNGRPLPVEHGFPVRLVVPGLYGYVSATKWLTELKVTRFADDAGYWTPRGWSALGPVKTSSRIDVPRRGATVQRSPDGLVVVAGVAWAQHRGIDAVEVAVDDGPWQRAELAAEPTTDAWRAWRLRWAASPGEHVLTVRAGDGTGAVQTSAQAPPAPDGATGLHRVEVTVT
ncbi:MAG TPA: molybdopterin-dependent oxidoreductase [Dermatophilaceae bacterium]|nr:molybdopterin-dependent oxidoreductase [Dermatophilaceae bacterium]